MANHVRKFLDTSTAHLSEDDAEWCSNNAENAIADVAMFGGRQAPLISETPYGFFFYASEERYMEMPDSVWALMQKARELGCDYVLLDRDAEAIDDLPTYHEMDEWDGTGPCPKCQGESCDPEGGCIHDE